MTDPTCNAPERPLTADVGDQTSTLTYDEIIELLAAEYTDEPSPEIPLAF